MLARTVLSVLVLAGLAAAGPGSARAESAAGKAALSRAIQFAPFGAVGVVHVDCGSAAKIVAAAFKSGALPGGQAAGFAKIALKFTAIDVYLLPGRRGEPMPVLVLHGKLAGQDVVALWSSFGGAKISKGANGRYGPADTKPPSMAILGTEASDLPDGVTVIGPARLLTDELVAGIGKGTNHILPGLLKRIDTSAEAWGGMDLRSLKDPSAPVMIRGSLYLVTKGPSKLDMIFRNEKAAAEFEKTLVRGRAGMFSSFTAIANVRRQGAKVTMAAKTTDPILPVLLRSVLRARTLAKRAVSGLCLNGIGKALALYANDPNNRGGGPPDLFVLVEEGLIGYRSLISPSSGRKLAKGPDGKLYTNRSDYIYLWQVNMDAPGDLVVVYEPPALNRGEGTNILLNNGVVMWVSPEVFRKKLKKTMDWIKANKAGKNPKKDEAF